MAGGHRSYYALAIPTWLRDWANRDTCSATPEPVSAGPGMTGEAWTRCPAGVSVAGGVLPAGGHTWFQSIGAAAGDEMLLAYFEQHSLRPAATSWAPPATPPVPVLNARMIAIRSMRVYRLPEPGSEPFDITAGRPDGAMWVSAQDGIIARVTTEGAVSEVALPSPGSNPDGIAAGPGKSIWVTETGSDAIVEISLR